MVIIAIVLGLIWLVSSWYISDILYHYYDNYDILWSTPPYDIVKYWKMCKKEGDKVSGFQKWILIINIASFIIGVIVILTILV